MKIFENLIKFEHKTPYGSILGLQILTDEELDILSESKEKRVLLYLSDSLGKHSQVTVVLDHDNTEVVSDVPEDIVVFRQLFPSGILGFNILDVVKEALEYGGEAS